MPTVEATAEMYRTSTVLAGMVNLPRAGVFLRDKLFSKIVTAPTDQVDVSFYKGKAKLAPYCSRFSAGIAVPRERQQLRLFSPAHIKVVRTLTADDVFYRSMSVPGANTDERDAQLLALDITELDNDISRREEWMAFQAAIRDSRLDGTKALQEPSCRRRAAGRRSSRHGWTKLRERALLREWTLHGLVAFRPLWARW